MAGSDLREIGDFLLRQTAARFAMFAPGDRVVVGVSGGADSVALLLGLCALKSEWGLTLQAVHVNHQLRGEDAQADEAFVAALCAKHEVALTVYQADVRGLADRAGLSLEDAGRRLRYKYLQAALTAFNAQKIAVAHTRDDSAETVLMNLCRGAGLKGLCGIPPVRGAVVRPLIETSRAAVEAFLAAQGASYRTDASNFDPAYTRNRVRHRLMPVIAEQLGNKAAAVIARNALHLADDEAYLAAQAQAAFLSCLQGMENDRLGAHTATAGVVVTLDISALQALPPALIRRVLRKGLALCMNGNMADGNGIDGNMIDGNMIDGITEAAEAAEAAQTAQTTQTAETAKTAETTVATVKDVGMRDLARILALLEGQTGRIAELPHGLRARREYQRLVLYRLKNFINKDIGDNHSGAANENAVTVNAATGEETITDQSADSLVLAAYGLKWPLLADKPFSVAFTPEEPETSVAAETLDTPSVFDMSAYVPALHKSIRLSLTKPTESIECTESTKSSESSESSESTESIKSSESTESIKSTDSAQSCYAHGYTKKFRYDNIQAVFTLRTRLPGDRIYIAGVGHRKLQDYFTDTKTPRSLRDRIPLLAIGNDILWIMDGKNRANALFTPKPGQPSVCVTIY